MRSSTSAGRPEDWSLRAAAVVTVLISAALWVGPSLLRPDLVDDDATQHIYWLYQYADPLLFVDDLSVRYFHTSAPLGYRILYALIVPHVDALFAAGLLSILLLALSGWLAWKIVFSIDAPMPGLRATIAVAALMLFVYATRNSGGVFWTLAFQRTFALPLLLLCLCGLVSGRYLMTASSWIGAALFYPVMLPVMGLASGGVFLRDCRIHRRLPARTPALVGLGLAALALAWFGIPRAEELGPAFTYAQAATMPEFGPGGRLQLHGEGLVTDLLRFHMMGLGWPPLALLGIAACAGVSWVLGQRRQLPPAAWILLGSGLGLWLAMRVFPEQLMFGLYLPNRHARWTIAAFGVLAVPAGIGALLATVQLRLPGAVREHWTSRACNSVAIGAPLVLISFLLPHALQQLRVPPDPDLERIYAFIESLPKDTVVGAHPDLADFIPLRSRRSVLTSTEESMPWMKGYYALVKPRVEALLRAAYATSLSEFDSALEPFGVDVFVTGPPVWSKTGYLEPYDTMVQQLLADGKLHGFALRQPPEERVMFRSGGYYVLRAAAP